MPIVAHLRHAETTLHNASQALQSVVCEHRLSQRSYDAELAHGRIRRPEPKPTTSYYPFAAANPVAPYTAGVRKAGYTASAYWGASVAISLMRNEGPFLGAYIVRYLSPPIAEIVRNERRRAQAHRPGVGRNEVAALGRPQALANAGVLGLYASLGSIAVCAAMVTAFEWIGGTGHSCAADVRHPNRGGVIGTVTGFRDLGFLGYLRGYLINAADRSAAQDKDWQEFGHVAAGLACAIASLTCRVAAGTFTGTVATLGAIFGLMYEACHRLALACFRGRPGDDFLPLAHVELQERLRLAGQGELANGEHVPAPLIDFLWNQRGFGARGIAEYNLRVDNQVVHNLVGGLLILEEIARQHLHHDAIGPHLRPFALGPARLNDVIAHARPAALAPVHPAAGNVPRAGTQSVHGMGRDQATRRSVTPLIRRYHALDVAATLAEIRAYLVAVGQPGSRLAHAHHPSGQRAVSAARLALGGFAEENTHFRSVAHAGNGLTIDEDNLGVQPMARVCAVMWRAIADIEVPPTDELGRERRQEERRDAFILALSRCVEADGHIVCAPGQSQRLVLILQGYVAGVQVEIYDAPAPVAQFVTMQAMGMHQRLGDEPPFDEDAVKAIFNEACMAGYAIYQGPDRVLLQDQFRALISLTYDIENWLPPAG